MTAIAGEPFRGLSVVRITDAGGTRAYTASIVDVDPLTAGADQASWEGTPGSAFTVRFEWATSGVPLFSQADFARVFARLPGDATDIGATSWAPAISGDNGSVTRTFHFDDSPTNNASGVARCGMIELVVQVARTAIPTWGNHDSRDSATSPPVGSSLASARGYYRAAVVLASHLAPSNVSVGGASPSLFAFPDPIHNRVTLSAVKYRSSTLELRMVRGGTSTSERSQVLGAQSTVDHNYSWTGTTSTNRRVGTGIFLGSEAKDLKVISPANSFGGDSEYAWAASGHEAGWVVNSETEITNAAEMTVDPRLCVRNDGAIAGTDNGALFHQQNDTSTFFDPPPLGDHDPGQRIFPDVAFLSVRYANARGEGQDGLSVTLKMWHSQNIGGSEASPSHTFSGTTATRPDPPPTPGSPQAGWLPLAASGSDENLLPLTWSVVIGGTWRVKSVLTAPADAVGLEAYPETDGGSLFWNRNVFMVTANPNNVPIISIHPESLGSHGSHLTPDDELIPVVYLKDQTTQKLVELVPANGDGVTITLLREHHPTMRVDYFDFVAEAWVQKAIGGDIPAAGQLALVRGSVHTVGGDPDIWTTATHLGGDIFAPDGLGGELDSTIVADIVKDGVHYSAFSAVVLVGGYFKHNHPNESTIPFDSESYYQSTLLAGTASITNGSDQVTGAGTAFLTDFEIGKRVQFSGDSTIYIVRHVASNTLLTILPVFAGTTGSGKTVTRYGTGHIHEGVVSSFSRTRLDPLLLGVHGKLGKM